MAQRFFIVDVEAWGSSPRGGQMTEFGVVEVATESWFHGVIYDAKPSAENPACPDPATARWRPRYSYTFEGNQFDSPEVYEGSNEAERAVYRKFRDWVASFDGDPRCIRSIGVTQ